MKAIRSSRKFIANKRDVDDTVVVVLSLHAGQLRSGSLRTSEDVGQAQRSGTQRYNHARAPTDSPT